MRALNLTELEQIEGGSYDGCVLGTAASAAITGGTMGAITGPGFLVAATAGWISGAIGGMVGCAIKYYY